MVYYKARDGLRQCVEPYLSIVFPLLLPLPSNKEAASYLKRLTEVLVLYFSLALSFRNNAEE